MIICKYNSVIKEGGVQTWNFKINNKKKRNFCLDLIYFVIIIIIYFDGAFNLDILFKGILKISAKNVENSGRWYMCTFWVILIRKNADQFSPLLEFVWTWVRHSSRY